MRHEAPPPRWAFKAALWLAASLDWLRDLITPAPVRVLEKGFQFMSSAVLFTLCRLKVPDALGQGWNTLSSLSSRTGDLQCRMCTIDISQIVLD